MTARNAAQFRAIIRNRAKKAQLPAQVVLQQYMLERLLARVSMSAYRGNIILKGGFLISAITGIESRSTMDMDVTVIGMPLSRDVVKDMFEDLCRIDAGDGIAFSAGRAEDIRKDDLYAGVRMHLKAVMRSFSDAKMPAVDLTVDVTTGDAITPGRIEFSYSPVFEEDDSISCLAYPVATIISEKVETILQRAEGSTRPRDFYDAHILYRLHAPAPNELRNALKYTCVHRQSVAVLIDPISIVKRVQASARMRQRWREYQQQFPYARDILFDDCCGTIEKILQDCSFC